MVKINKNVWNSIQNNRLEYLCAPKYIIIKNLFFFLFNKVPENINFIKIKTSKNKK